MTESSQKTRGDRRDEIVQATLSLAFEVGPASVSTSLIAKRLRVSQPAIYRHFDSKDAIWLEVSSRLARRIAENLQDCMDSDQPPQKRLRDLVLRHIAFIEEVPALPDIMVMRDATASYLEMRQNLQSAMSKLRDLMIDLIAEAQERGRIRKDFAATDVATLFIGIVQGLVLRMIVTRDHSRLVNEGARLLDLQLAAVSPGETT